MSTAPEPSISRQPCVDHVDPDAVARELRGAVRGEVHFDLTHRAVYATATKHPRVCGVDDCVNLGSRDVALNNTNSLHRAKILLLPWD